MKCAGIRRSRSPRGRKAAQRGQALVYGLFVLVGGLSALFFLFNTGQLQQEKSKMVTTTDAVAYSVGVMHARALNYAAYTNRAMIANEVAIAQMVSVSSWIAYLETLANSTGQLGCATYYNELVVKGMVQFAPLCMGLYWVNTYVPISTITQFVQPIAEGAAGVSEAAKFALQASQTAMVASMPGARRDVMNEVARANYLGDGDIEVDAVPLMDTYSVFEGEHAMVPYTRRGDERERFREATLAATRLDTFIADRSWRDEATLPTCFDPLPHHDYVQRAGGTSLIGYDEWRALDTASIWRYQLRGKKKKTCKDDEQALGYGAQAATDGGSGSNDDAPGAKVNPIATSQASSNDWNYTGLPTFFELSDKALAYDPDADDKDKRDPRFRFAIRLRRENDQTRTSQGRSGIESTPRLNAYVAQPARGDYASVSASEVYFLRPKERDDGKQELASLFNPYWQARLIDAAVQVRAAQALQGAIVP